MEEIIRSVRSRVAYLASFVFASVLLLFWSAAAHAQSREDQYGSPTDPVDSAGRVADTLSVLPETGGPLILLVGGALIVGGTVLGLLGRIGRR